MTGGDAGLNLWGGGDAGLSYVESSDDDGVVGVVSMTMPSSSSSSPSCVRGMAGGDAGLNQLGGGDFGLSYVLSTFGAQFFVQY